MSSVNKVLIIGRLGKEPELRKTAHGVSCCTLSVATSEKFKDKQGQQQEQTEWHNVVAWNKSADIMAQYLSKGSIVYIEGKLKTDSWEDNGVKKYKTNIIVSQFQFLDGKREAWQNNQQQFQQPAHQQFQQQMLLSQENEMPF